MTPPTPDITALEQWARQRATYYEGQPAAQAYHDVLALCETVREMQAEIDQRTQAWAVAADERDRANGEKDAAVARAEQAERERDVYGDALTSLSPKVEALQEAEETAREAIAERDAARAEVAQLRDIAELEATIATLREQLDDQIGINKALDKHAIKLGNDLAVAQAEIATLREQLEHEAIRLAACGVAAMGNTPEMVEQRIGRDNPAWSASYGDVCAAVDREMALREQLQAAQADTERMDWLDGLADRTEYQNKRVGHRPVSSDMHFDYGRARLYVRNQEGRVVVSGEGTVREAIDAARVKQAHPTPAQEGQ